MIEGPGVPEVEPDDGQTVAIRPHPTCWIQVVPPVAIGTFWFSSTADSWFRVLYVAGLAAFIVGMVLLGRTRVVLDADGISQRRWRTERWAWADLEAVCRSPSDSAKDEVTVFLVPRTGRRRKVLPWNAIGQPVREAEFNRRVLERAAAAGVDATSPRRRLRSGARAGLPPFIDVPK